MGSLVTLRTLLSFLYETDGGKMASERYQVCLKSRHFKNAPMSVWTASGHLEHGSTGIPLSMTLREAEALATKLQVHFDQSAKWFHPEKVPSKPWTPPQVQVRSVK
jgi:hypothetical protein